MNAWFFLFAGIAIFGTVFAAEAYDWQRTVQVIQSRDGSVSVVERGTVLAPGRGPVLIEHTMPGDSWYNPCGSAGFQDMTAHRGEPKCIQKRH